MSILKTTLRWFTDGAAHSLLFGASGNDGVTPVVAIVDDLTNELVGITHEHHFIHTGKTFRYNDSITLNAAASQTYLITTPNTPTMRAHLTVYMDGTAVTTFDIFKDSDRVGTTLQTAYNANFNSANAPTVTVHKGTSGGTTDGTRVQRYSGGTATNQSRSSATADFDNEWILEANKKYLITILSGTAGNLCNITLNWYENTPL